jgi:predicted sulfurtransferase
LFISSLCLKFSKTAMMRDGALWNALNPALAQRSDTVVLRQKSRRRTVLQQHHDNYNEGDMQGHDDEGRPVVTLDTRNQFEVDAGTFKNTLQWGITKFTEFPDAVQAHLDALQDKTVISFCTGGIRCEKAAIFMRNAGLPHVYQLEGGILKYFEEVGNDHYDGGCFVFDERRAVGADLRATGLAPDGTFPITPPTASTPQT